MLKSLLIICLITKTHSWTWDNYPSPRGTTYWKCGVLKPSYVCDSDGMLTDQQRKEIVDLVEDFKEKTKRPKSEYQCHRDGLRLVVALAKKKIGSNTVTSNITGLCHNNRSWTSLNKTDCATDMHGIEFNTDGFRYCYEIRWEMSLDKEEFEKLNETEGYNLDDKNYFGALKRYIINLRMLYIHRFSIFDVNVASNEDKIKLSDVHHSLQDTRKTLTEMQQSLDQQNKTSSDFHAAIEENKLKISELRQSFDQGNKTLSGFQTAIGETNKKLSEMRQLLSQTQINIGRNTTTPLEFRPVFQQFSNNL
uniref:Candidate secreted effector n=1 Tax=Meloidogyne incognita TaxID=6306 RepID=A0A914KFW5_MELIC